MPNMLDQSNAEIDDFRVEWIKMILLITSMPAMLDPSNADLDSFRAGLTGSKWYCLLLPCHAGSK